MGRKQKIRIGRRVGAHREMLMSRVRRYYGEERVADGLPEMLDDDLQRQYTEAAMAIYRQPWATEEELERINDRLAPHWLSGMHWDDLHGAVLVELACQIAASRPKLVLDAGCGVGLDSVFLALQFPDVQFVGTDLSARMIGYAQTRAQRRQRRVQNARFLVAAHRELPACFPDTRFDMVVTHGSCVYVDADHLAQHCAAFAAVLRSGGQWFTEMPFEQPPDHFLGAITALAPQFDLPNGNAIRTLRLHGEEVCWNAVFRRK
ncbi:methyltransferase domain-containing protein [Candidatus Uhrbacteria bacterium]|nr:methyltransferase domain-containing protein [Candidatus Uhrbacteria bacterium]